MLWIPGASGQVGQALVKRLRERNIPHKAFSRRELDICNIDALEHTIGPEGIIVNTAAFTDVDLAETQSEQAFAVNRDGVANLAKLAQRRDQPLIHISTDYVFDGTARRPYRETDRINPSSIYGRSKADGEAQIRLLHARHIIIRTSWVFSGTGRNFVKTMLNLAAKTDTIRVVDDQRGCPTAAADIADMLIAVSEKIANRGFDQWRTYHFAGAGAVTWFEFAREIFKSNDQVKLVPITTEEFPSAAARPANSELDCTALQEIFSISRPDWRRAVAEVVKSLGANDIVSN
jgi:dTDP-4-dehydrorhamnose reductase